MDKIKTLDKLYLFYEKYFNNIVVLVVFIGSNIFYWLNHFNIGSGENITTFLAERILAPRESILVTVATVFLGIYFTVFSILGTIKAESTLGTIPKKNFFKLITFIKNAFLFAFSYLFYTIFYPWLAEQLVSYPKQLLNLFLIILFLYMFLSALKVGLALFVVFRKDLSNLHESIEKQKLETKKQREIFLRLENFLNEKDEIKDRNRAIIMNEIAKRKNPK
ncbi:hypothetical protein [Virgibacillus sp. DJP39]|uniref:hypothetical protein n=1 Tax=Virgibacillus sp. DJP39 TaxID=3409790 RepID=UPI003BB737BE